MASSRSRKAGLKTCARPRPGVCADRWAHYRDGAHIRDDMYCPKCDGEDGSREDVFHAKHCRHYCGACSGRKRKHRPECYEQGKVRRVAQRTAGPPKDVKQKKLPFSFTSPQTSRTAVPSGAARAASEEVEVTESPGLPMEPPAAAAAKHPGLGANGDVAMQLATVIAALMEQAKPVHVPGNFGSCNSALTFAVNNSMNNSSFVANSAVLSPPPPRNHTAEDFEQLPHRGCESHQAQQQLDAAEGMPIAPADRPPVPTTRTSMPGDAAEAPPEPNMNMSTPPAEGHPEPDEPEYHPRVHLCAPARPALASSFNLPACERGQSPYNLRRVSALLDSVIIAHWRPRLAQHVHRPTEVEMTQPSLLSVLNAPEPPHPDDFRYGKMLICDWISSYNVSLACDRCNSTMLHSTGVWTHQATSKGVRIPAAQADDNSSAAATSQHNAQEGSQSQATSRVSAGIWHVVDCSGRRNFATAMMHQCSSCNRQQHDLMPGVMRQLPQLVLEELMVSPEAMQASERGFAVAVDVQRMWEFAVHNGHGVGRFHEWLQHTYAMQDEDMCTRQVANHVLPMAGRMWPDACCRVRCRRSCVPMKHRFRVPMKHLC